MVLDIQEDLCIESQCHQDHLPNEAYDQNGQPLGDVQADILTNCPGFGQENEMGIAYSSTFSGVFGQRYMYKGISLQERPSV